ncbi:ribbon-helix-helix protein, CopG family [Methylosinus sp. LW3]|uniref:ribbon-helix-helix protein, CopG family n=1 Tax=unclassified Methylosinus TaxID=2624500 RepID=UPI000A034F23
MAKSIEVLPKKRGRPATGKDPMLNFRAPPALVERVDKWAAKQDDAPSRSEAIRRLLEKALGQCGIN